MKKGLMLGLSLLATTGCGVEAGVEETVGQQAQAASGDVQRVPGDSLCPQDQYLMPIMTAQASLTRICDTLAEGDVVRLEGGGSVERGAPGCVVNDRDLRPLSSSLCTPRPPAPYFEYRSDAGLCPEEATLMTVETALAKRTELCAFMGKWDIVRLAGGGSIVGSGYGCVINLNDTRNIVWLMCESHAFPFSRVAGDGPCTPGQALVSPGEARARQSELCPLLTKWAIMRLSGGGTMRGPGYGCAISDWAPAPVGESLCKTL